MKIGESFSYQFEDIQWPAKLGLGGLISLVPILNLAVAGYEVAIIRSVAAGAAELLPNWDDFGHKFWDGLILAAAGLVYATPLLIVICLPLTLLALCGAVSQNGNMQDLVRSFGRIGALLGVCLFGLLLLYTFLLSVLRPIILIIFSRDGTFASCFRFREMLSVLTGSPRPFFETWIVIIVASIVIGLIVGFLNLVAGWIPFLGWIVGMLLAVGSATYILTIDAYLFGQFRVAALGPAESKTAVQSQ